jgi:hypothetical protein
LLKVKGEGAAVSLREGVGTPRGVAAARNSRADDLPDDAPVVSDSLPIHYKKKQSGLAVFDELVK